MYTKSEYLCFRQLPFSFCSNKYDGWIHIDSRAKIDNEGSEEKFNKFRGIL